MSTQSYAGSGASRMRTCGCAMAQPLRFRPGMSRITVMGDKSISAQARTYAEYRVFATLTRHAREFRCARVLLGERAGPGKCDTVTCSVTVTLKSSGSIRTRVTGPHAYAAINRAVERLSTALEARVEQRRRRARRSPLPGGEGKSGPPLSI